MTVHISHIDLAYWNRLKKGDPEALGYFYDTYADKLFLTALQISDNRELAKDALQEVFIELWNYRETIAEIKHSPSYLVKVLRSILIKRLKKENLTSYYQIEESWVCSDRNMEDIIISSDTYKENNNTLHRALSRLTARQKLILQLRFYDGLSNEQIARKLCINYQSVSNLVFRTILRLRMQMCTVIIFSYLRLC